MQETWVPPVGWQDALEVTRTARPWAWLHVHSPSLSTSWLRGMKRTELRLRRRPPILHYRDTSPCLIQRTPRVIARARLPPWAGPRWSPHTLSPLHPLWRPGKGRVGCGVHPTLSTDDCLGQLQQCQSWGVYKTEKLEWGLIFHPHNHKGPFKIPTNETEKLEWGLIFYPHNHKGPFKIPTNVFSQMCW